MKSEQPRGLWGLKCIKTVSNRLMPLAYVIKLLNWTPTFRWYVARPVIMSGHHTDMRCNEIGLCAQNIDTILDQQSNTIGRVYLIT